MLCHRRFLRLLATANFFPLLLQQRVVGASAKAGGWVVGAAARNAQEMDGAVFVLISEAADARPLLSAKPNCPGAEFSSSQSRCVRGRWRCGKGAVRYLSWAPPR